MTSANYTTRKVNIYLNTTAVDYYVATHLIQHDKQKLLRELRNLQLFIDISTRNKGAQLLVEIQHCKHGTAITDNYSQQSTDMIDSLATYCTI